MKRIFITLSQKWPEYLLEIIVITVGILGAFALNNWNENLKRQEQKADTIQELIIEYEENFIFINDVLKSAQIQLNAYDSLIQLLETNENLNIGSIKNKILLTLQFLTYNPSQGSIQSVSSSSGFQLIENVALKQMILNATGSYADYKENEGWYINATNRTRLHIAKCYPLDRKDLKSSNAISECDLNNFQLENQLRMAFGNLKEVVREAGRIKNEIHFILTELPKE